VSSRPRFWFTGGGGIAAQTIMASVRLRANTNVRINKFRFIFFPLSLNFDKPGFSKKEPLPLPSCWNFFRHNPPLFHQIRRGLAFE
jgi:hypothetical protein